MIKLIILINPLLQGLFQMSCHGPVPDELGEEPAKTIN